MTRVEWIHERFKVGPPPLCERVGNLPLIIDTLARELSPRRRQALVETRFEAFDLFIIGLEVIAWSSKIRGISSRSHCGEMWDGRMGRRTA